MIVTVKTRKRIPFISPSNHCRFIQNGSKGLTNENFCSRLNLTYFDCHEMMISMKGLRVAIKRAVACGRLPLIIEGSTPINHNQFNEQGHETLTKSNVERVSSSSILSVCVTCSLSQGEKCRVLNVQIRNHLQKEATAAAKGFVICRWLCLNLSSSGIQAREVFFFGDFWDNFERVSRQFWEIQRSRDSVYQNKRNDPGYFGHLHGGNRWSHLDFSVCFPLMPANSEFPFFQDSLILVKHSSF